ncbi:MAG: response regulator [Verrucomicrobia bacterium]|nr:response regulator [Cytophagales bacterium]
MNAPKFTTVMLIDDNEIDNLINQKIIEASSICKNILTHTSGRSAIEFLKNVEKLGSSVSEALPEIIFLDIDMPLMDGFQFLEEFEKLSHITKEYSKVIMLTSSINPQDVGKSKKYEYVKQYLNKPLTQESLKKLEI